MALLPPDDSEDFDGEVPFNKDDYPSVWASYDEAASAYEIFTGNWHASEGGFSAEDMYNFVTEARVYYDDDGNIEYVEFDWETPDGDYHGTARFS